MPISAITEKLMARIRTASSSLNLEIIPEESAGPTAYLYSEFNGGSIEVEVAEFLYGLVRMTKPQFIFETGTHKGISSLYMAEGCKDNDRGYVMTIDIDPYYTEWTRKFHALMDITDWCDVVTGDSAFFWRSILAQFPSHPEWGGWIDILFLDSEPNLRYKEFANYFNFVRPGGLIFIHDLHPNMSYSPGVINPDHPQLGEFWPYGDFRPSLGNMLKDREIMPIHFHGLPRGFTMFYKVADDDVDINWAAGKLEIK